MNIEKIFQMNLLDVLLFTKSLKIKKVFRFEEGNTNKLKLIMLRNGMKVAPEKVLKSTQCNCSSTMLLVYFCFAVSSLVSYSLVSYQKIIKMYNHINSDSL